MILQNLKEANKLTSGVMASNSIHSLQNPRFLEAYNEMTRDVSKKLLKNANAREVNIIKKIHGLKKLHKNYGHDNRHLFAQFSKEDLQE